MIATPRTDSYLQNAEITCADDMAIHAAAFARLLERELAAERERTGRAEAELAKLRQKLMCYEHAEAADILHPPQEETK